MDETENTRDGGFWRTRPVCWSADILQSYADHPESTSLEPHILNRDPAGRAGAYPADPVPRLFLIKPHPGGVSALYYWREDRIYPVSSVKAGFAIALEDAGYLTRICEEVGPAEAGRPRSWTNLLGKIPEIREVLATDIQAFYDGDPAAYSTDEIILSYPGLMAISDLPDRPRAPGS